jgi:integrase
VPLYRRPGSPVWYIDLRGAGGGRTRRSTGTTDKRAAKRQHDELAARLWKARQEGRRLDDALLAWAEERPRGDSDLRNLRVLRAELANPPLFDIDDALLRDRLDGRSAATYNRLVNVVRAALNLAVVRGWLERAPKLTRRKVIRSEPRWLTRDEWARLRAELPGHLRPMADFAVATGIRWGNVAGLTWDRVDMRRRLVTVAAQRAKGRRSLSIPLSPAALDALRAAAAGQKGAGDARRPRTGLVFTYAGGALRSPKTAWASAIARAGIAPARWHDLRHTWASWHVQALTPLAVLKELGGWASIEQVQVYAHLARGQAAAYAGNAERGHTAGHRSEKAA